MFKSLLLVTTFLFSQASFAADLKCADKAVRAATEKNFKRFDASTNSCGAKLLTSGLYSETYLVCISDETDPSEWVVVVSKNAGKCIVKYVDSQYDSETPNFEDESGLLETVSCNAEYGSDEGVVCQ
jgi:hypothetical protein